MALKKFNKLLSNFRFSQIFVREILLLSLLFGLLLILFFHTSTTQLLFVIGVVLIFDLIILNYVGYKRGKEVDEIKSVIRAIRKNKISTEEEISLSKSLIDLEGNIKAMFRRTQEDLESMEKLAQARSEFLGYVSHELRTPIFTIQGYLETLLNGAIDDQKVNKTFLQKAMNHSENLNTLLNDLIDISMIESGLMSLSFRFFNLHTFLTGILSEINFAEINKNIEIKLSDFDKEIEVYGDKEKLRQVFNNLLSNAIKYTKEGVIEVIVLDKPKSVTIKIKDTGIGIPEKDLRRIFERFYRTERERSSSVPGTGLGLSIVKHILEAHKTTIEVTSTENVGSEFSFKLRKE